MPSIRKRAVRKTVRKHARSSRQNPARVQERFLTLMALLRVSGNALSKIIPISQQGLSAYTAGRRRVIQPVLANRLRQIEVAHIAAGRVDTNTDITDTCEEGQAMDWRDFALHAPTCVECYTNMLYRAGHGM